MGAAVTEVGPSSSTQQPASPVGGGRIAGSDTGGAGGACTACGGPVGGLAFEGRGVSLVAPELTMGLRREFSQLGDVTFNGVRWCIVVTPNEQEAWLVKTISSGEPR